MMKILDPILNSIKRRGLIDTVKMIISELKFDKLNNIDTSDVVTLDEMTIDRESTKDCGQYMPSNSVILEHIFNYLEDKYDFSDSSLIDYGCGKGRAIIYAHKFGFKKIIGVEFGHELCVIAKSNIENLMLKNIEIFENDATIFEIPNDIDVFYFFNPFVGDIMDKVIQNINTHKKILNKKILIIYVNPICKDMFIKNNYNIVYEYKDEVVLFEK